MPGKKNDDHDFDSYRKLPVWQKAMECAVSVYEQARTLPEDERLGLVQQLLEAAIHVASNIADAHGRTVRTETVEQLGHARGSLFRLETCIILCGRVGFWEEEIVEDLLSQTARVLKMLDGLLNQIDSK
jgi:four helix bundle protein